MGAQEASLDIWTLRPLASQTRGGGAFSWPHPPTPWPQETVAWTPPLPCPGHLGSLLLRRPSAPRLAESKQDICRPEPLTARHMHTAVVPALSSHIGLPGSSLLLTPGQVPLLPLPAPPGPACLRWASSKTDPGSQYGAPWTTWTPVTTSQGLFAPLQPRTPPSSRFGVPRSHHLQPPFPSPHLALLLLSDLPSPSQSPLFQARSHVSSMPRPQHPSTQCEPKVKSIQRGETARKASPSAPRHLHRLCGETRGTARPRAPARRPAAAVSQGNPRVPLPFPPLASGLTCEVLGEDQGDQQDEDEHGADGDHAVKQRRQRAAAAARPARPPCRPARRAGSARAASPRPAAPSPCPWTAPGWCMGARRTRGAGPAAGAGGVRLAAPRAGSGRPGQRGAAGGAGAAAPPRLRPRRVLPAGAAAGPLAAGGGCSPPRGGLFYLRRLAA